MIEVAWFCVGASVGAVVAVVACSLWQRNRRSITEQVLEEQRQEKAGELSAIVGELKTSFAILSQEALAASKSDFLQLAETKLEKQVTQGSETLESKKKLIDARLEEMNAKLGDVNRVIQAIEKQRATSHGSLTNQLEKVTQVTTHLQDTTSKLREALASSQHRGQWGERMAEDVLRLAGFVEGINYTKHERQESGTRPDFTFPLPGELRVNMDVKFPLDNYLKVLEAADEKSRQSYAAQFVKDVRTRVREVTTRSYIDVAKGTVDYALVFIPNERIYGFIHEHDGALMDDAMRSKVVLCSPLTLYAVLAVIRQAAEQLQLNQSANEILDLLGAFRKQWAKYVESMARMGQRIDDAAREYHELTGVRTRQLDRQIDKIDDLQAAREIHPLLGSSEPLDPPIKLK